MMMCPECGGDGAVFDSRAESHSVVWRRRKCRSCEHRWTTWESVSRPETSALVSAVATLARLQAEFQTEIDRLSAVDEARAKPSERADQHGATGRRQ